tara:strand:- start:1488 stop:2015 length:528 start_codon:yes stop_codon:yes gene_type:complete
MILKKTNTMYRKYIISCLIFLSCFLKGQSFVENQFLIKDYQLSSEQYISSDDGKVYMNVNFWGAAGNAGTFQVYEGIDFASLMSAVGGPGDFANLKKIRLYREKPDEDGQLVHIVDLTPFLKNGDRSNFPKIKPNDTLVFKKTLAGVLIEDLSTVQALLTAFTFFIQLSTIFNLI